LRGHGEEFGVWKWHLENGHYRTLAYAGEVERNCSVFACALVFSPVRMAGQTACPEGSLARARKDCDAGGREDLKVLTFQIWILRFGGCGIGAREILDSDRHEITILECDHETTNLERVHETINHEATNQE
jgi:hypothetical protein